MRSFVLMSLALLLALPVDAADVTLQLPASDGFVIRDNTGATERLRVDEATGNISRNGALFVHTTALALPVVLVPRVSSPKATLREPMVLLRRADSHLEHHGF